MSEYFFGVGKGQVPEQVQKQLKVIAAKHGASFTNPRLPGEGYRYWFAGPNLGDPFDRELKKSVLADVAAAGLVLP